MPILTCKCGKLTTPATSNFWVEASIDDNKPTECVIAWVNNIAVRGCHFDKSPEESGFKEPSPEVIQSIQSQIDRWNTKYSGKISVEEFYKYD